VSDAEPHLAGLSELAGGLGLHEHRCLIYDTQEEQFAAALPFLRAGLARGERCIFVADENSAAAVLDALRKGGIDVDGYVKSGGLIVTGKQGTYLRGRRFDPDWLIGLLSQATGEQGGDRFSGLRILGEMTWALEADVPLDSLIEYEAKLTHFVHDHNVRVLCQYNRNRFSPELLLRVIRTHPVVVYGALVCRNPYYVPPEELLKPHQASLEVERLLKNILSWEDSFAQLRALAARLESVREEERTRAAREIHDELGQALTAIRLEYMALLRDLPAGQGPASQRSQTILTLLDQAFQSVRRIATELRPGILDDLGLAAAVEWVTEEFRARTGMKVQVSLPDADIAIDRERATALFRILQETLTNVARHANATWVYVRLTKENGDLLLEVRDNGKGISEEQLSTGKSLGLLGMRERAALLGGEITISGVPGRGTTVSVRIPEASNAHPE